MEEGRVSRASQFGDLLRRHRLEAQLSLEALAERARMSARGIGALERGDRRTPQRDTVALLADALGLAPEQRKAFEEAANPVGSRRPTAWATKPETNLPLPLTSFIGRATEVAEISALLREHRLVTVTGAGGIGKTRTTLEVAAAYNDASGGGAWLVDLAPVTDASHVTAAIAAALGAQEAPNRALLDVLIAALERKPVLLVLDNCEHVIDEARTVAAAIARRCASVRILATSREALAIGGERLYLLLPLETVDAVRLFADRASAVNHRFALTEDVAPQVADICRRLDGMPLALELGAACMQVLSAAELANGLADRFRLLTRGDRTAPQRQRTIRALIDWSYELLDEPERLLFCSLAVFAGGFTLETAAALQARLGGAADATIGLISSLAGKSLLQVEPDDGGTRYRMLESIHAYARERLQEQGELVAAARAHATVFAALADDACDAYARSTDDEWRARIAPELDDWRAALAWCFAGGGDGGIGRRIVGALRWAWTAFAPADGRHWTRVALATADAESDGGVVARLHFADAQNRSWLTQAQASYEAAARALALLERANGDADLAEARWRTGNALAGLERPAEAEALLREALDALRRLDRPKVLCWTLLSLAYARAQLGDLGTARALGYEGVATARAHEFSSVANIILGSLAEFEFRSGDAETALRLAGEALGDARALGAFERANHLSNATAYLIALERYGEAMTHAREALDVTRAIRADYIEAIVLQHVATVAALRKDRDGDAAVARARRENAARLLGFVDARLASLGVVREYTEARQYDATVAALQAALGAPSFQRRLGEGPLWDERRARTEAAEL